MGKELYDKIKLMRSLRKQIERGQNTEQARMSLARIVGEITGVE